MKVLVSYSGGKDSQACLLWAVNNYGFKNIEAVFCDTGWEHPATYKHVIDTTKILNVKLVTVKSKKYDNMIDLAVKKKRFPSSQARFCTSELKSIPFIDYILEQKEHLLIIQGIRRLESHSRSLMSKQCRFFKYYFEPYNSKNKTHSYRKKEIKEWVSKYSDDILRPVFEWTSQQVIDYIIANNQEPNILYKQGFKRVGCFPCIMCSHAELYEIIKRYPERFDEIIKHEHCIGSSFFKIDAIPAYAQKGICKRTKKRFTTAVDLRSYLLAKNPSVNLFSDNSNFSCSSYYNLCE